MNSSSNLTRQESLAATPHKHPLVEEIWAEDGILTLRYPLAMRPFWTSILEKFTGKPQELFHKDLALDEYGTALWLLIDGQRSVRELILRFAKEKKMSHADTEKSITLFLRELGKRQLIAMAEPANSHS